MTSVLLDSITATTDAFAGMSSTNVSFTYAKLSWTNVSSSLDVSGTPINSGFRVVHEDGTTTSPESSMVLAGEQVEVTISPLEAGAQYKFYLERYEIDTWVRQTSSSASLDYVMVTTPTTTLSVASGSTTAMVTFPTPIVGLDYSVIYGVAEGSLSSSATIFYPRSTSGDSGETLLTGLTQGLNYTVALLVTENGATTELHETDFFTSANAEMVMTGPFASYMGIDWSASVDGQGSQYKIVNRVDSQDDVLAESSTQTSATIQDLQPGSEYRIVLQRLEIDDSWSDQNEVVANTLCSSMSVTSSASKTLELSWTSLYTGAVFELMYSTSGSMVSNGQTQELSTILRDLNAGTTYDLELVVHELGQAVGLASLGMTTNEGSFLQTKGKLIAGVVALIALLITLMMKKG